jgi:E3 ubiquitin-protein ligase RNF115/126
MIRENLRFPYWCHICRRETFPVTNESGEPSCNFCRQTYIEEIGSYREDHPREENRNLINDNFSQSMHNNRLAGRRAESTRRTPRVTSFTFFTSPMTIQSINGNPILRLMFSNGNNFQNFFQQHHGDQQFENLINLIMQNDPNRYGTPPASEKSVEQLKKEKIEESNKENYEKQDCSVCKENYKLGDLISTMPCQHIFHEECLLPWLKQHNSCPVCRYELPTEDKDYEARKAEVRDEMNNNQNNRRRNNSHTHPRRAHHLHQYETNNQSRFGRNNQTNRNNTRSDNNNASNDINMN